MGARCCSDRKEEGEAKRPQVAATIAVDKPERQKSLRPSVSNYGGSRGISMSYHGTGDDSQKFDKAFQDNDLKMFVQLLDSNEPIDPFPEKMHPWAADPTTIGSLAGTQMAILASIAEKDSATIKDDLREAGAIPKLVGFLRSGQPDRVHTALVALSFITAENPKNAMALYKENSMGLFVKMLDSDIHGLRAAVATTARDMMVDNMEARMEFFKLGGTKALIHQLTAPHDPMLVLVDVQLEAALNVQDYIEDDTTGEVIPEIAKEVVKFGGREALKKLLTSEDEEVRGSVEEILSSLQPF